MKITRWVATLALAAAAGTVAAAGPAHADLADDIDALTVASEQPAGYDRSLFGDYDRDGLLATNQDDWPCDGYYSLADDTCYALADFGGDPEVADDEVDVDHIVALAEAWASGAHDWSDADLDEFAGTTANLWLMTDNLNSSKGADDPADWLPPHTPAVCDYLDRYVTVKTEWSLSVDEAEQDALSEAAAGCTSNGDGDGDGNGGQDGRDTESPGQDGQAGGDDEGLPETGNTAVWIGGAAVLLLTVGGGLFLVARRRRTSFIT